ncbi:MAG: CHASE domain-containing protein [Flavobacteriaceae bacterium]
MLRRFLPLLVFLAVGLIGAGITYVVYQTSNAAAETRFSALADDAASRIEDRIRQHIGLLVATQALFEANKGEVSRDSFRIFVDRLDLAARFEGLRGLGFARLMPQGSEYIAEADLNQNYGERIAVHPADGAEWRTPIVLLEPDDARNRAALGYDMYSDPVRREAIRKSWEDGTASATAPVELVQEITDKKQAGFLIYLPFRNGVADPDGELANPIRTAGFVYMPFRAGDLHEAALNNPGPLPLVVDTYDSTGGAHQELYRSEGYDSVAADSRFSARRLVEVAGRIWTVDMHATPGFAPGNVFLYVFSVGAISLLLAAALAVSTRAYLQSVESARELTAVSEKTIQEKDLMLQEMKHRIKNMLARVLAISRNTAATSDSLEAYGQSFGARMQAMANAQDLLTRSHWQRADLRELLMKELEQVFGAALDPAQVSGPPVDLAERAAQALSLTFHELATNALKYGPVSDEDGAVSVHWRYRGSGKDRRVVIEWKEISGRPVEPPQGKGFGTRLIDANIRGELGGTIERIYADDGMTIRIAIPRA